MTPPDLTAEAGAPYDIDISAWHRWPLAAAGRGRPSIWVPSPGRSRSAREKIVTVAAGCFHDRTNSSRLQPAAAGSAPICHGCGPFIHQLQILAGPKWCAQFWIHIRPTDFALKVNKFFGVPTLVFPRMCSTALLVNSEVRHSSATPLFCQNQRSTFNIQILISCD